MSSHRTILKLDPHHPTTQKAVADAHLMHHHVMSGFADTLPETDLFAAIDNGHTTSRKDRNILFAVDHRPDNQVWVLVQSDIPGNWGNTDIADAVTTTPVDTTVTFPTSGNVRYQIIANPTKKQHRNQKRIGLTHPDAIENWWHRQATTAGLDVNNHPVTVTPTGVLRPRSSRKRRPFTVVTARITGRGTVVDGEAFTRACREGVGRSAAYGCGLLLALPT